MNAELQDIIHKSAFKVQEGMYIYAQAKTTPTNQNHFMVAKDGEEITVVTRQEHLHEVDLIERNKDDWALIALHVSIPFYCPGFLAAVTGAIEKQGMDVLVISTYSKDYLLVKHDLLGTAKDTLRTLGMKEKG